MSAHITISVISVLLLAGVLTVFQAPAATSTATATATVISPTNVANDATAELLKGSASGVLSLRIPSGFCTSSNRCDEEVVELTLSSIWMQGTTIVISTSDSTPKASLVLALAQSAKGMNGILSTGQGVNLFVTHTELDGTGRGRVYAIIAYN